jgi:hypothetical protein
MVRVSSKAEIEGIAERVSVMLDGHEKIDLLLARNADEQLSKVDWNKLNSTISRRLDKTQQTKTYRIGLPSVFKIAAGVAAAAAVVLITLMMKPESPADMKLGNGRTAMVEFIESKGSASVEIKGASGRSHVIVDIGRDRMLAKCNVKIIDSNGSRKQNDTQAAWIIISRPEPLYPDNGVNRDMMDVIYLF